MAQKLVVIRSLITNRITHFVSGAQKRYRKFYTEQHQLTSTTALDRYPELFQEAKRYCEKYFSSERLTILSYGCSTGEECISLRRYFAEAQIVGADINKSNLNKASVQNGGPGISYLLSSPENIGNAGPFNLIFCLSVLCRWEETKDITNCEKIYSFSKFESTLRVLNDNLAVGGILVVYNSNFRFEDTVISRLFEILPTPSVACSGFVHKFDNRNNRLYEPHTNCIYRKVRE